MKNRLPQLKAAEYVPQDVTSAFVALITQTDDLQPKIVYSLFETMNDLITTQAHQLEKQKTLLQVSIWCVGEFGDILMEFFEKEKNMSRSFSNFFQFFQK